MAAPEQTKAGGEKLPYSAPTLTVYGDLRSITAQKDRNRDDAGQPKTWGSGMP